MKKLVLLVLTLVYSSAGFSQTVTYTCVMHPEIHATKPGNCPKCGMALIKEKPKAVKKPVAKKPTVTKTKKRYGSNKTYSCSCKRYDRNKKR